VLRLADQTGTGLLGLLAEQASQLLPADKLEFAEMGIVSTVPYLGGIKLGPRGTIQLIEPDAILASGHDPVAAPDAA
jgi:hypothetical protein